MRANVHSLKHPAPPRTATRAAGGLHIPSLDGIRAIAALIVFVSHAGLENVVPGAFGVTIFFFLSGYLITTLLRQEYEQTGAIGLSRFYLRRVCRIIPPLYIVLILLLLPVGWAETHSRPPASAVAAQFAQLTNYYVVLRGSRQLVPDTLATWSLAVEEHFYLLYPLLLVGLLRFFDYRRVALALVAICVTVLAWRCWLIYGLHVAYNYTFYATDSRVDSLLYGCLMALAFNPAFDQRLRDLSTAAWSVILVLAGGLLAFTFLDRSEAFRATWRYSIQGIALMPIFFTAVSKNFWPVYRWLETRPLRYLGLISYTFYLVHERALHLASRYVPGAKSVQGLVAFAGTVAFASAMYYLVERHLAVVRRRLHSFLRVPATGAAPAGP